MTTKRYGRTVDALKATKHIGDKMTFGGLVRSLRMSDEISQVALAKKIGVSKQFLSDVEHNRKDIGISFAKRVASALGYPIEPLLELLIKQQLKRQRLHYTVEIKKAS
ncbi:MAG TPA: helix-turn-helix transcriptional regulator [Gammaproteobacteria bacterium]|jgi:transcriptional regulator with XRE-family HTH domain|nr:helix-turn-helix transcriptional regulator [Gammaproteobacteria bacterium]